MCQIRGTVVFLFFARQSKPQNRYTETREPHHCASCDVQHPWGGPSYPRLRINDRRCEDISPNVLISRVLRPIQQHGQVEAEVATSSSTTDTASLSMQGKTPSCEQKTRRVLRDGAYQPVPSTTKKQKRLPKMSHCQKYMFFPKRIREMRSPPWFSIHLDPAPGRGDVQTVVSAAPNDSMLLHQLQHPLRATQLMERDKLSVVPCPPLTVDDGNLDQPPLNGLPNCGDC